jgi:hypothetical protein
LIPRAILVVACVVALPACGERGAALPGDHSPPRATGGASASSSAGGVASAAPLDAAATPRWERAQSGDPADLAELADAEGARGLARRLDDPALGRTALAALEHAADAELATGLLARRAAARPATAEAELEVLLAVLSSPRRVGERLDPEGELEAVDALLGLAREASHPRRVRALALSCLGRLAERGLVDRAALPPLER